MRRLIRTTLLACGLLVVGGTVAWATGLTGFGFVGSDGTITACVQNSNGNVRFVDPAATKRDLNSCRADESLVVLNQTGPKGDPGPPGPPGSSPGPASVEVDCSAGQSIQQAIDEADPIQPLTVTVKGTCTEEVRISRSNLTLTAESAGDGIQAPAGGFAAVSLNGARSVTLDGLTLTGGNSTLSAFNGSSFTGFDLQLSGAGSTAVDVGLGSSGQLNDPSIVGAGQNGIQAHDGGSVSVQGGTVSDSGAFGIGAQGGSVSLGGGVSVTGSGQIGVYAAFGGSIDASSLTVSGSVGSGVMANEGGSIHLNGGFGSGVLIENNGQQGVSANNNGAVDISNGTHVTGNAGGGVMSYDSSAVQVEGAVVDDNSGNGVSLDNASSAEIHDSTISGNSGDGVHVSDTSVAQFGYPSGNNTVVGNGGWGVRCDGAPSVALIRFPVGTVTGNDAGAVDCPTA